MFYIRKLERYTVICDGRKYSHRMPLDTLERAQELAAKLCNRYEKRVDVYEANGRACTPDNYVGCCEFEEYMDTGAYWIPKE